MHSITAHYTPSELSNAAEKLDRITAITRRSIFLKTLYFVGAFDPMPLDETVALSVAFQSGDCNPYILPIIPEHSPE
jgi:hypothetical protein